MSTTVCLNGGDPDDDRPNFAVIRLKPESNLLGLFQLLLCNGFGEVAFVKSLNDANFGGNNNNSNSNKETAATTSNSNTTQQKNIETGSKTETCNGKSAALAKRPNDQGTKQSTILESSIQKLIDAKKQRMAAAKQALVATEKAVSGTTGGLGKQVGVHGSGTRQPSSILSMDSLLSSTSPISLILQNTDHQLSIDQNLGSFDKPTSPLLPLSTFSCPLPLPVDRTAVQKSANESTPKKSPVSKPKVTPASPQKPVSTAITKSPAQSQATTIASTRPVIQRSTSISKEPTTPKPEPMPSGTPNFVQCHLCQSKIMATRFSNLTNHVRRHAPVKQFQCVYCDYAHNEIAKVRLHMTNNHGDKRSRPLNNINTDMQETWRRLMRECFPERSKRQKAPKPIPPEITQQQNQRVSATAIIATQGTPITSKVADQKRGSIDQKKSIQSDSATDMVLAALHYSALEEEDDSDGTFQFDADRDDGQIDNGDKMDESDGSSLRFARCDQCYAYVDVNMKESHVRACHMENVPSITHVCSVCGLENIDRRQLEIHIRIEHDESDQAEIKTVEADLSSHVDHLINEYFPLDALEYTSNFEKISAGNSNGNSEFDSLMFGGDAFGTILSNGDSNQSINGIGEPSIGSGQSDQLMIGSDQSDFDSDQNLFDRFSTASSSSEATQLKCRVCQRMVSDSKIMEHAQKHMTRSVVVYECPICSDYRSGAMERVKRHLIEKHEVIDGSMDPKIVKHTRIPATAFDSSVQSAINRCFGIVGSYTNKRKSLLKKASPTKVSPRKSMKK